MTLEELVLDLTNKGYEVTFKMWSGTTDVQVCVEQPGQFSGAKPFSGGPTTLDSVLIAARHAGVRGY